MLCNNIYRATLFNQRVPASQLLVIARHYSPSERLPLTQDQEKLYPQVEQELTDEGFPVLKLAPTRRSVFNDRPKYERRPSRFKHEIREQSMSEDQDWPSIWPTAKTFVPSAVPLPLRQSYESKSGAVPRSKYSNTELLKVVNFLHLTPDAVKRHCLALKKFCTEWPEGLDTDEEVRSHFPVTSVTRDYVHASNNIRDPRTRLVTLEVKVDDLKLNERDRRKLTELLAHRYSPETGVLKITADACPTRIQNQDYAEYLLSAVYFESQEHQDWEDEYVDENAIYKIDLDKYREDVEQKLGLRR